MCGCVASLWNIGTPIIDEKRKDNLMTFKYVSSDASISYNYFWSPLAAKLVNYFPMCIAPNLITAVSSLCMVVSHIVISYYSWNFTGDIPAWVCIFCAIGYMLYVLLDNIDGKQARRTNTSTPLGLVYDHGGDALVCILGTICIVCVMEMGNNIYGIMTVLLTAIPFWFATLEEYYAGGLHLPILNGPSDGFVLVLGLYITSAIFGSKFWTQHITFWIIEDMQLNHIFASMSAMIHSLQVLKSILESLKQKGTVLEFIYNILPFICLQVLIVLSNYYSPSNIIETHPRLMFYFYGCLYMKICLDLQIAHITDSKYKSDNPVVMFCMCLYFVYMGSAYFFQYVPFSEEYLLYFLITLSCLTFVHVIVHLSLECKVIFDIYLFSIKPKNEEIQMQSKKEQ